MKRYRILIITTCAVLAGGVLFTAWANSKKWFFHKDEEAFTVNAVHEYTTEEKAALSELAQVYSHADTLQMMRIFGRVSVIDPADSTASIHADFLFARKHDSIYYALGDDRMICLPDIYIAVNDAIRKIFVLPPKQLQAPFHLPADTLLKMYGEEGYEVEITTASPYKTVRLYRNNHISCKEFKVTWQEAQQAIKEVSMRLTDLDDPLNSDRDKIVTIQIYDWQVGPPANGLFTKTDYIQQKSGQWMPAPDLSDYELIVPNK